METLTIPPKHHVEAMLRLRDSKGKRIVIEIASPEGRVAMTGLLQDIKPFQTVWVYLGKEIKGFDFIGREVAIRSIKPVYDVNIEKSKLYDNEANLPEELDYTKKTRLEVHRLRTESFGERIADALRAPQLGNNPVILRGSYLGEHPKESDAPAV